MNTKSSARDQLLTPGGLLTETGYLDALVALADEITAKREAKALHKVGELTPPKTAANAKQTKTKSASLPSESTPPPAAQKSKLSSRKAA